MQRTFIILPEFDKNWKSMGLSDEDLRRLENLILQDPEAAYPKNEKENRSKAERNNIRKVIECLEHTVRS